MDNLYKSLCDTFSKELENLSIGYSFNQCSLEKMNDIINSIDYIENNQISRSEIIKIINFYG